MGDWTGRHVLVTGATGFVGGNLARRLLAEGARVRAAVRSVDKAPEGCEASAFDLTDPGTFGPAVADVEVVFSVAAWVGLDGGVDGDATNVVSARELVQAAVAAGVQRFVHVSTCGVYGVPARLPITEDTPPDLQQKDRYHVSKALGEQAARAASEGTELVIVRPGLVYGPGSRGWTAGMLKLVKKGTPVIMGRGDGHAFPVFIDNLVDGLLLAGSVPEAAGRTFHLVDTEVPWADWFGYFGKMCGKKPRRIPLIAARLLARAGEVLPLGLPLDRERLRLMRAPLTFDTSAARDVLGWAPAVSIDEGMRRAEAWLQETGRLPPG